jgi:hypothetical protein
MGVGGNPGSTSSLDPRQEHAGVTEWTLSCISRNPQALETALVPALIEKIHILDHHGHKSMGLTHSKPWLRLWTRPSGILPDTG